MTGSFCSNSQLNNVKTALLIQTNKQTNKQIKQQQQQQQTQVPIEWQTDSRIGARSIMGSFGGAIACAKIFSLTQEQ